MAFLLLWALIKLNASIWVYVLFGAFYVLGVWNNTRINKELDQLRSDVKTLNEIVSKIIK